MQVALDGKLLKSLIDECGGVPSFLERWNAAGPVDDDPIDRTTVYRWRNGETLPKNSDALLRLAGTLNIDPFALFNVPAGEVVAAAEEILRMVQFTRAEPACLQFARDFFGRQKSWPPGHIATNYFKRFWHAQDFSHDPEDRANYYGSIIVDHTAFELGAAPQVFHFAFRHPTAFYARWLQYGFVRVHGKTVTLQHINGQSDQRELSKPTQSITIETWFGPSPAQFRVASLHSFSLVTSSDGQESGAVRFVG